MSKVDQSFQALCAEIFKNGREYENKNRGVKRLQIPSYTFRHSFADGFPAISNKEIYWKGIVCELIWFLRGDNDITYLNQNGVKIWNKDAYNWYKQFTSDNPKLSFTEFSKIGVGSVGRNYSVQWRNFNYEIDQILNLITDMKKDIMSSRLKVNAWNPSEIFDTALPPCHSEFQVIGVPLTREERKSFSKFSDEDWNDIVEKGLEMEALEGIPKFGFELHWNQRSVDTFLGLPFNIASYGLLAKILERLTGFPALSIEGTLKCVHFYDNQYEAAELLLSRSATAHNNCELIISDNVKEVFFLDDEDSHCHSRTLDNIFSEMKVEDFNLVDYTFDEAIKVDMLAPTK